MPRILWPIMRAVRTLTATEHASQWLKTLSCDATWLGLLADGGDRDATLGQDKGAEDQNSRRT
jgi:hypothetical protein